MSATANMLLYWMSHQGTVSDRALRGAMNSLVHDSNEEERTKCFRAIRNRLLLLAHILSEKNVWRVMSPYLLLISDGVGEEGVAEAVFIGGRTPNSLAEWRHTAAINRCKFTKETLSLAPTRISLSGSPASVASAASALNIPLIQHAAFQALRHAPEIEKRIQHATVSQPPSGVIPEVYDIGTGQWIQREPKAFDACRYEPLYGAFSYFTMLTQGYVKNDDAGEAVFLAAHLQRHVLCTYNPETHQFTAPKEVPFAIARALCLCSGRPSQRVIGSFHYVYSNVSHPLANAVMKRLGQDFSASLLNSLESDTRIPLIQWFD